MTEQFKNGQTQFEVPPILREQHGLSGWSGPDLEAIKTNMTTVPESQRVTPPEFAQYEALASGKIPIDIPIFQYFQH